jgi:uncharacterized membrane protein YbhN (UPF0104 family)
MPSGPPRIVAPSLASATGSGRTPQRLQTTRHRAPPTAPFTPDLGGVPADLPLPAVELRVLARRAAVPALVLGVVIGAVLLSGTSLQPFADALTRALNAHPGWVVAAVFFELLSFGGYIALLWHVASRATPRLGLVASAQVSLGGAAATRLLPAGGLGGVAMTIWALRRAGLGTREATRTLLAFLIVLYSVFVAAMAIAGAMLALGLSAGDGPLGFSAVPAIVATLTIIGALLLAMRRTAGGDTAEPAAAVSRARLMREKAHHVPGSVGAAVRDAITLIRSGDPRLLGAPAWWAFDAAVLWAMLHALGTPPVLTVVVLGYVVGQVANTLPLPGAVSGGMVGVLLAFGVAADLALGAVLAYRAVAIWLPAPIGLLALRGLGRTVARWACDDYVPRVRPSAATAVGVSVPVDGQRRREPALEAS